MKKNSSRFFQNRDCEYFPCHEIENTEAFNCLQKQAKVKLLTGE